MAEFLICIRTYLNRMSAENAKNFLEIHGIPAMLSTDDAGGVRPELTLARGVKLRVARENESAARELLQEIENQNPAEQSDEHGPKEEARGFLSRFRKWLRGG